MTQLELAESIARKAHRGQYRHDGITPYITHVEKVVSMVYTFDAKVLAWLHDVVEDNKYLDAEYLLDEGVDAGYVCSLNRLTHEKGDLYTKYIEGIVGDDLAVIVKIADIVSNLINKPSKRQITKYKDALTILALERR
jgi:(p)ppGpp synthase/HD superfamily hydrolase